MLVWSQIAARFQAYEFEIKPLLSALSKLEHLKLLDMFCFPLGIPSPVDETIQLKSLILRNIATPSLDGLLNWFDWESVESLEVLSGDDQQDILLGLCPLTKLKTHSSLEWLVVSEEYPGWATYSALDSSRKPSRGVVRLQPKLTRHEICFGWCSGGYEQRH